jgi:trigger factor
MIGMSNGETKDVWVKFPEDYHAAEFAGKDAKFIVTIIENRGQ